MSNNIPVPSEGSPYSHRLCMLAREAHTAGDIEHAIVALRALVGRGLTPEQATQSGRHLCFLRSQFLEGKFHDGTPITEMK